MDSIKSEHMPTEVSMSDEFYIQLAQAVENHLSDESFGVEELAQEVGVSRSNIHRKLQALTGQSVSQFIREIRLQRAHELLIEKTGTASEISYKVGFSSPSYFNKCFHEFFGYPPGEASKRHVAPILLPKGSDPVTTKSKKGRNWGLFAGGAVVIIILGFFLFNNVIRKKLVASTVSKSIAVLPFKTIGGDLEGQYFADGVQEEILNHLAAIEQLKVKSRTSVEKFRDRAPTTEELASGLGLTHFLEGSARKIGNNIRITVQLIDANTNDHIWTSNYDRQYTDIWETQASIAKIVANELQLTIAPETLQSIEKKPTQNPTAWDLYLKSQYHKNQIQKRYSDDDYNKMVNYLKAAIDEDPDFALAYAKLAELYNAGIVSRGTIKNDSALILADIALSKDSMLAEPYLVKAQHYAGGTKDTEEALRNLRKAITLAPNDPTPLFRYAQYHYYKNWDHQTALRYLFKAIELGPEKYELAQILGTIGHYYTDLMDYDRAVEYCEASISYFPDYDDLKGPIGHLRNITSRVEPDTTAFAEAEKDEIRRGNPNLVNQFLAMGFFEHGQYDSCVYYWDKAGMKVGWDERGAIALLRLGRKQEANKVLQEAIEKNKHANSVANVPRRYPEISRQYALLGEKDSALHYLEKQLSGNIYWGMLWHIENIPHYDSLRDDPDYQRIIAAGTQKVALKRAEVKAMAELGEIPGSLAELTLPEY